MIICVRDLWNKKEYIFLNENSLEEQKQIQFQSLPSIKDVFYSKGNGKEIVKPAKKHAIKIIHVDGYYAGHLDSILKTSPAFLNRLMNDPKLKEYQMIKYKIDPPSRQFIDFRWFFMLSIILWDKIECEFLMAWLSTLGGGFSSLGDQFERCALIAGNISLKQLKLGHRSGDPIVQCRCKLYYSISLIQTGRLRAAKKLIRKQYKFALQNIDIDGRLVRMCQGIWMKLQYEYSLRLAQKKPGFVDPLKIHSQHTFISNKSIK